MLEKLASIDRNYLIFFTDLDGTLLDHDSYSYQPAEEALAELRSRDIPLILASSKTAAEISPLRRELGFQSYEAIVENGAGILPAGNSNIRSADQYQKLLDHIADTPARYLDSFRGFSQWSTKELSDLTGLTMASAALAKDRQFSEPGLWAGSEEDFRVFCTILNESGIVVQTGGRFLTLSFGGNKVDRMHEIIETQRSGTRNRFCVALGDAPNDIAMLEAADLGIVVPNPSHGGMGKNKSELTAKLIHARLPGPLGWNEAVLKVLDSIKEGELSG